MKGRLVETLRSKMRDTQSQVWLIIIQEMFKI